MYVETFKTVKARELKAGDRVRVSRPVQGDVDGEIERVIVKIDGVCAGERYVAVVFSDWKDPVMLGVDEEIELVCNKWDDSRYIKLSDARLSEKFYLKQQLESAWQDIETAVESYNGMQYEVDSFASDVADDIRTDMDALNDENDPENDLRDAADELLSEWGDPYWDEFYLETDIDPLSEQLEAKPVDSGAEN